MQKQLVPSLGGVAAVCLIAAALAPASARAQVQRELVVIVDASANMGGFCYGYNVYGDPPGTPRRYACTDDAPYKAQLEGVKRLVREHLPHQGKVALTVVQTTGGLETTDSGTGITAMSGPEVIVPRTVVFDETDVDTIVAQLTAARQIKGNRCLLYFEDDCPHPASAVAWGMHVATEHLLEETAMQPRGDSVEYCLVGDLAWQWGIFEPQGAVLVGPPEVAFSRSAAWAEAKHKVDLDRFSMVGMFTGVISDPDLSAEGNALQQEDHVNEQFGWMLRGGGDVTQTLTANEFIRAIPNGCFAEDVELMGIEVTQGLQNLNHDMQLLSRKPTAVRALLRTQERKDARVDIVLHGWNNSGYLGEIEGLFTPARVVEGNPILDFEKRVDFFTSQIFQLPPSWTDSGGLTVEVEQVGADLICSEQVLDPGETRDCKFSVAFKADRPPARTRLHLIRDPAYLAESEVPGRAIARSPNRVLMQHPINGIEVLSIDDIDMPSALPPAADEALRWNYVYELHERIQTIRDVKCMRSGECNVVHHGMFQIAPSRGGGVGSLGNDFAVVEDVAVLDIPPFQEHGAHEWGHAFGLDHAAVDLCGGELAEGFTVLRDPWPWVGYVWGANGPALSQLEPPQASAWGLDLEALGVGIRLPRIVRRPDRNRDVMSYCVPNWTSTITYKYLSDEIPLRLAFPPTPAGDPAAPLASYLLVTGEANDDGTATLDPAMRTPLPQGSEDTTGPWTVRARNSGGAVIDEVSVTPTAAPHAYGTPPPRSARFTAAIPYNGNIRQIEVVDPLGTSTLVVGSASGPVVVWSFPGFAAVLDGEETLMWSSVDLDGDPLTYWVEYSPDAQQSWELLAANLTDDMLTIDTSRLRGSTQGYFRVSVSDGVRSSQAIQGPVTVTRGGPRVVLSAPDGASYHHRQPVSLAAYAIDAEDGPLGDAAFTWTSDLDGPVGAGREPGLLAEDLSVGTHQITVTATDSDGDTGSASVSVTITTDLAASEEASGPDMVPEVEMPLEVRDSLTNTLIASVTNLGNESATQPVLLELRVEDGLDVVSVDAGPDFNCATVADVVTCVWLGTSLGAGETTDVVMVDIDPDPTFLGAGTYQGQVTGTATTADDARPGNDVGDFGTLVRTASFVDLTVRSEREGIWAEGFSTGIELFVDNVGEAEVGDAITVTYQVPPGAVVRSAGGDGWQCDLLPDGASCTWVGAPLLPGETLPSIWLEVDVGSAGGATTVAAVQTALDGNAGNDSLEQVADVVRLATAAGDLALFASFPAGLWAGSRCALAVEVQNRGMTSPAGPHVVEVPLPAEATFAFATGEGWSCSETAGLVSCTHPDVPLTTLGQLPPLWVYVDVDPAASTTLSFPVLRAAPFDENASNDSRLLEGAVAQTFYGDLNVRMTPSTTLAAPQGSVDLEVVVENVGSLQPSGPTLRFEVTHLGPHPLWWEVLDNGGWTCSRYVSGSIRCERTLTLNPGDEAPPVTLRGNPAPFADRARIYGRILVGQNYFQPDDGAPLELPIEGGGWSPGSVGYVLGNQAASAELWLRSEADGRFAQQVTADASQGEQDPAFSPDGRLVAFARDVLGVFGTRIFVQPTSGGPATALTVSTQNIVDSDPTFSPDGQWVWFARQYPNYDRTLWKVRPDGSDLTEVTSPTMGARYPQVAPDGRVFFGGWREIAPDVYEEGFFVMNPDGTGITLVNDLIPDPQGFALAPDGSRFLMVGNATGLGLGLFLAPADPGDPTPVVEVLDGVDLGLPSLDFHPDGDLVLIGANGVTVNDVLLHRLSDGRTWYTGEGRDSVFAPVPPQDRFTPGPEAFAQTLMGAPITVDVLEGASDPSGDPLRVLHTGRAAGGSVSCEATGLCTYTPRGLFVGRDTFSVEVFDGQAYHTRLTARVEVAPPPPRLRIDTPLAGQGVPVPPGTVALAGGLRLDVPSEDIYAFVIIDMSAINLSNTNIDCDGDGLTGQPSDDVNGDGQIQLLDCYLTSVEKLTGDLAHVPNLKVGLVLTGVNSAFDANESEDYEPNVRFADMSPFGGLQKVTGIADDEDGNGLPDLIDVVRSVSGQGNNCTNDYGAYRFDDTAPFQCRLGTDSTYWYDDDALAALDAAFAELGPGRRALYWFSAAGRNISSGEGAPVWDLLGAPLHYQALAPTVFGCDPGGPLPWMAERTEGSCEITLNDPLGLQPGLPSLYLPDVTSLTARREGDAPVVLARPFADAFNASVAGIVPGPNDLHVDVVTAFGAEARATVTVYGQDGLYNTPPTAVDDLVTGAGTDVVEVNVLANDTDVDADPLTVWSVGTPSSGAVRCDEQGACRYTPPAAPSWPATFTYQASDGRGGLSEATVTLVDTLPDLPPDAPPQAFLVDASETIAFNLLDPITGATDPEGGALAVVGAGPATLGDVTCDAAGACTYTAPSEGGVLDIFTYLVEDVGGQRSTGFVYVDVRGAGRPDLSLSVTPGSSVTAGGAGSVTVNPVHLAGEAVPWLRVRVVLPEGVAPAGPSAGWACSFEGYLVDCLHNDEVGPFAPAPPLVLALGASIAAPTGAQLARAGLEAPGDADLFNNEVDFTLTVLPGDGVPDAGPGPVDAGPGTVDAGPGPVDAGPGPVDAGPGPVDAGPGPAPDAGAPVDDAGAPPDDAGVPPVDAGPRPPDAGPSTDAGPGPAPDGGPSPEPDPEPGVTPGDGDDAGAVDGDGGPIGVPGCGCGSSPMPSSSPAAAGALALAGLVLVVGRRRRRVC